MADLEHGELTSQILAVEQDERRRIALFLHDGPVQSLAGIALMMDAALHFIEKGETQQARDVLSSALERHRLTIGELRDLSFSLEPVVLRDQGFTIAVQALADQRGAEHGVLIELDVEPAERLGPQTQAALYEIVREALETSIRRGPPKRFGVKVELTESTLDMTIDDDAPAERRRRSLEVLAERARTLGASLQVRRIDNGSQLKLSLPRSSTTE